MGTRITVAQVAEALAKLNEQVENNEHHLNRIRAARGITLAHAKHDRLVKQFADLEQRFNAALKSGDVDDPRFAAVNDELSRVNQRVTDLFNDLQGQIANLQQQVNETNERVDVLYDHPSHPFSLPDTTVDSTATVSQEQNWLAAVIVGLVAGILMYISIENFRWAEVWKAHSFVASLVVAVAVFFITLGLTSRIAVNVASRLNFHRIPEPQPQPEEPPVVVTDDTPPAEPMDTRVFAAVPAASDDAEPPTPGMLDEFLYGRTPHPDEVSARVTA